MKNIIFLIVLIILFSAMSLEIRPLAALYPQALFFLDYTIERSANAVGMSIPPPATTESPISIFFVWGGGITLPGV